MKFLGGFFCIWANKQRRREDEERFFARSSCPDYCGSAWRDEGYVMIIFPPSWLITISFAERDNTEVVGRDACVACCTDVIYLVAVRETILQAADVMGGRGSDSGKK